MYVLAVSLEGSIFICNFVAFTFTSSNVTYTMFNMTSGAIDAAITFVTFADT